MRSLTGAIEYWPQKDQMPYRMITGLRLLKAEDDWMELDCFYEEEMALRKKILETRKEVGGHTPIPRPGSDANLTLYPHAGGHLIGRPARCHCHS